MGGRLSVSDLRRLVKFKKRKKKNERAIQALREIGKEGGENQL